MIMGVDLDALHLTKVKRLLNNLDRRVLNACANIILWRKIAFFNFMNEKMKGYPLFSGVIVTVQLYI